MLKKMPIIFKILICYFQMDCNSSFIVLARTKKNRTTQHSENQNKGNKQRHEYNKAKGK